MKLPALSLIGTGALGSALLRAVARSGMTLQSCFNRRPEKARRLRDELFPGAHAGDFPTRSAELGALVILAVPDSQVEPVAEKLAGLPGSWEDRHLVHCSGSLTSGALSPAGERGAGLASFHPLQTFTGRSGAEDFHEIWFSTEGDARTLELLEGFAGRLGARLLRVRPEQKTHIHLAAVFASNYVMALMHTAGEAGAGGGVEPEELQRALAPLMHRTAENIRRDGLDSALSGPIARGDVDTVRRHLELLEGDPGLRELYRRLGRQMLDLVKKSKKRGDPETAKYLEELMGR